MNQLFTLAIGPALSVTGFMTGNSGLADLATVVTSTNFVIGAGILVVVVLGVIASVSGKTLFRLMSICTYAGVVSLLLMVFVLLTTSHSDFVTRFNAYSASFAGNGDYYNEVISLANRPSGGFSWTDTIGLVPLAAWMFLFTSGQQFVGGEIKNVKRTSYMAIALTLILGGSLAALLGYLVDNVMGHSFLVAVNSIWGSPSYKLPISPLFNYLVLLATPNLALMGLIQWLFVGWYLAIPMLNFVLVLRLLAGYFFRQSDAKLLC